MCTPIVCPRCHKPGFVGCGRHVEQVLAHVPKEQRCKCQEPPPPPPKKERVDLC